LIIFESLEEGKKEQTDSKLVTLRCLAVQFFAIITIAPASDLLPPGTPLANEMEATHRWCNLGEALATISKPA
jgi:hypothetical protein